MISKKYRAFSFVEVIIIVLFLGIFAAIAVPRFNRAAISKNKAQTTARKIVTDLRLTRRLAISDAANNTQGYELQMAAPSPYASYEIVDCGPPPTIVDSHTIDSNVSITCATGPTFRFVPLGNLESGSGTEITVSAEGKTFTITIIPATGAVKCVEN
jgi:Tfp pilus assembly protein PilE